LNDYIQHNFSYAAVEGDVAGEGKRMGDDCNAQAQEAGVSDQGCKLRVYGVMM
jgi:hypothetical protein